MWQRRGNYASNCGLNLTTRQTSCTLAGHLIELGFGINSESSIFRYVLHHQEMSMPTTDYNNIVALLGPHFYNELILALPELLKIVAITVATHLAIFCNDKREARKGICI